MCPYTHIGIAIMHILYICNMTENTISFSATMFLHKKDWANYSKIGKDKYHCHLSYSYVACWNYEKSGITIEVYYVGSRENAPY